MKIDDSLSEVFEVKTMTPTEVIDTDGVIVSQSNNKIEDDYEVTRNNLRILLQQVLDLISVGQNIKLNISMVNVN